MFAIIETGGKQYRVEAGTKLDIEKLDVAAGDAISFDKVLLTASGENVKIGAPYLAGVSVAAKVVRQARDEKKIVFKYHSKARYRKKKGHRQMFTQVVVTGIK